jgi:hypothetical protein
MSDYKYFPIIKTRDAELRCFQNLEKNVLKQLLPIYELTKSRRTKKAPDGDIHRRMNQISEIQGDLPFILDLCTDDKYINPQIRGLLSHHHGFLDWQYFLFDIHSNKNIVPMVHVYEDEFGIADEVGEFVRVASEKKPSIAVRLPYDLDVDDLIKYIKSIVNHMNPSCTLYVLFDAEYVREIAESGVDKISDQYIQSCKAMDEFGTKIEDVVMLCTSFPSSVAAVGGHDSEGSFTIYEDQIYKSIIEECPIKYGDYASINTEQIEMKGGTFVPRIDISTADGSEFFYKRFRRSDGSYVRCASYMLKDPRYNNLECWADTEIELASNVKPTGISPSFWISVRMNHYIKRRLLLREFY